MGIGKGSPGCLAFDGDSFWNLSLTKNSHLTSVLQYGYEFANTYP